MESYSWIDWARPATEVLIYLFEGNYSMVEILKSLVMAVPPFVMAVATGYLATYAKKQTELAKEQREFNRQVVENQKVADRAHVKIFHEQNDIKTDDRGYGFPMYAKNEGRSPATIKKIAYKSEILRPSPPGSDPQGRRYTHIPVEGPKFLLPTESLRFNDYDFSKETLNQILGPDEKIGSLALNMYGAVYYSDEFGATYKSPFSYRYLIWKFPDADFTFTYLDEYHEMGVNPPHEDIEKP